MFFVYVLKSCGHDWYYVGLTTDPGKRLREHNLGGVSSTKFRRPYALVYKKEFVDRDRARDFEKYLKIRSNKEKLISSL